VGVGARRRHHSVLQGGRRHSPAHPVRVWRVRWARGQLGRMNFCRCARHHRRDFLMSRPVTSLLSLSVSPLSLALASPVDGSCPRRAQNRFTGPPELLTGAPRQPCAMAGIASATAARAGKEARGLRASSSSEQLGLARRGSRASNEPSRASSLSSFQLASLAKKDQFME
jgi:hypothetical protein